MSDNIIFSEYERMEDQVYWLSPNISLVFVVTMAKKGTNNEKVFFHYETEYTSNFVGSQTGRSIKRNLGFYFVFRNKNDFFNSIIMRPQDVFIFTMLIEKKVLPWFFGNKDQRIFSVVEDKLFITGKFNKVLYAQSESKWITIEPIVMEYSDNLCKEGVRMCFNYNDEYIDIDIDKFVGLFYILKNTDMYSVACSMLSYAKIPPYGINIYKGKGEGLGTTIPSDPNWSDSKNDNSQEQQKVQTTAKNFLGYAPRKMEDK